MTRIGYLPFLTVIFALLAGISTVHASSVQLGFLAPEDPPGEVAQAAYDWVSTVYRTTLLIPDETGAFKDSGGNARELDDFGVLWLHYSATNQLPAVFTSDAVMAAVLDYLNAGGTMYLSALAVYWVYSLGIETGGEPRIFSPLGKDPPEIGVVPTAEGAAHPIFAGFDTSGPIYFCSMAQDGFTSDFMPIAEVSGTLLATKTRGGGAGGGKNPSSSTRSETGESSSWDITTPFTPTANQKRERISGNSLLT